MRTRFSSPWVVCFVCLTTVACLRSLEGDKIPCTSSEHCPSHYTCLDGYCSRGSTVDSGRPSDAVAMDALTKGDGLRAERVETRLTEPDSATSAENPDALVTGGAGGAGIGGASGVVGTNGVDGGSGLASDAPVSTVATIGGSTTGGLTAGATTLGTSGAAGTGGVTSSTSSKTGGTVVASSSAAGAGGTSATSSPISSSSQAGASAGATTVTGGASSSSAGGVSASGGASSSGGTTATGGASSSSASTCQPKPRDCTSTLDNNCNGTPDNQETTSCACPVGQKRDCQEHPGYDGHGICKKGSQTCTASSDKTTSSWNDCSGFVAPGTEVCDAAGADENCNDQSNEGCECVNGASVPCDCGPATTCTNGKKGTCSVSKVPMYRDFDGDSHGETQATQVCPGTDGYVTSHDDCDDRDKSFYPGMQVCTTATQIKICESGGVISRPTCDYGCAGNQCHPLTDGTIGVPGYVTCTPSSSPCLTSEGCVTYDGSCGGTNPNFYCDGPNDCPAGYQCWLINPPMWVGTSCSATRPTDTGAALVCDPLASLCTPPLVCAKFNSAYPIYTCQ